MYFFFQKNKKNTCRYHYQNLNMIYVSWYIEQNLLKVVFSGHFMLFYPPPPKKKNPQRSKFWKMKTFARDIIILPMCTKNHNHMYGSLDREWDWHNFLSFRVILSLLPPPLITQKIKFLKKMKKIKFFLALGHFCHSSQLKTSKIKILKLKKTNLR